MENNAPSNVRTTRQPVVMLTHAYSDNETFSLTTTVAARFGNESRSTLDWQNAPNPRPDYYRNMPSFQPEGSEMRAWVEELWRTDPTVQQIDWAAMVERNRNDSPRAHYVVASRVQYRPYLKDGQVIHVALSSRFYKLGDKTEHRLSYRAGAPSTLVSEKFLRAELTDAKSEWKYAADVVMTLGRWYAQAEYLRTRVKRLDGAPAYDGEGGYAQVGYALLGGRYSYNMSTGMASSTGPKSLELLCRYNFTNMNDRGAGIMGGQQHDISVGASYYFNKHVALKASYTNVSVDKHSPVAGEQSFDMVQGRIQVSF